MRLGDREVYLRGSDGEQETVVLTIRLEFTHGEPWRGDPCNITGMIDVAGGGWDMTLKSYAADEIQAVGRLVRLAGAALLGACERDGKTLWTPDRTEALTDPLEIF